MIDKKMEDCNYFTIDFKSITNATQGRLFSTCDGTINIDFNNDFEMFEISEIDFISNDDVFLGNKNRFIDLEIGDCISVRNNAVIITDINYETIEEFNDFCSRKEQEEMNNY